MSDFNPISWNDYIGQTKLKERLRIHINGANERGEPMDHVLLMAPPGYGKTALAELIAKELNAPYEEYIMPIKPQVLRSIVMAFDGVVFFDEIHRLPNRRQEELLPLISDGYIQLDNGARLESGLLTVIGATTEPEQIIPPLHDRFFTPHFDDYTDDELGTIVQNMAKKLGIAFEIEAATRLGRACGGVPRKAEEFVSMSRDLDSTDIDLILEKCRMTEDGLTEQHLMYIHTVYSCGGVAGLDVLSAHMRLPKVILVDLERLLVKRSMIEYTKQGRGLTGPGYKIVSKTKGNQ